MLSALGAFYRSILPKRLEILSEADHGEEAEG